MFKTAHDQKRGLLEEDLAAARAQLARETGRRLEVEARLAAAEALLGAASTAAGGQDQAAVVRAHVAQLWALARASLDINSARTMGGVLEVINERARALIGAHQSVTSTTIDQSWSQAISAVYLSDKYARWRSFGSEPNITSDGSGIYSLCCRLNQTLRMTQAELEAHPAWKGFGKYRDQHPPMRGWLAVPLIDRDGANIGLIQLSDKQEGDFTEQDEATLVQLARIASVAIENARLYAAIERREQDYRFLANSIPQMVWTTRPDGWVDYFNERWIEYTGLTLEQSQGWGWTQILHPDDRQRCLDVWNRSVRTGETYEIQYRLKRGSDGGFRWHLARAMMMRDEQGQAVKWFGTCTDIDDQKRSEAQLEAVLEGAPVGIALLDPELRYLRLNKAFADMNGMPQGDHLGRRLRDVFPGIALALEPHLRRVLETGEPCVEQEVSVFTPSSPGVTRYWLVNDYPVRAEGQNIGLAAIVIEITHRKRVERALELLARSGFILTSSLDPEETLANLTRLIVPALADGCVVEIVEEGYVRTIAVSHVDPAKQAALRQLLDRDPFPADAMHGRPRVLRTGEPELLPELPKEILSSFASDPEGARGLLEIGAVSAMIVPMTVQGRAIGAITFLSGESGHHYADEDLLLAEELGRRAAASVQNAKLFELARKERQLAQEADRVKDEFLAIVSHELRTPLTAILGWSRMLQLGTLDEGRRQRAVESIERNAMAQTRLIEDLLDISRIITGKLRLSVSEVPLAPMIEDTLDAVRPAAEAKGVELAPPSICADARPILGDGDRLRQIAWNLLSNAVKFTLKGGVVRTRLHRDGAFMELVVEDTGQGIAADFLPYVFERFRQADTSTTRSLGGLGLGLAIVRHLVELHGGSVEARSEGLGRGSTFIVRLPISHLPLEETSCA